MKEGSGPDTDPPCCLVIFKGQELRELSDGTRVFAVQRQEQLERGVLSAQENDSLLRLIQERLLTTDRHLSAYLNEQDRTGLAPEEEQRIQTELTKHELKLLEMSRRKEDVEMPKRVCFQIDITQKLLQEVSAKLRLLRGSGGFEGRLRECEQVLGEVCQKMPELGIGSTEQDVLESQLQQCMKYYRCLSKLKVEVEAVVKTGRQMADDEQTEDPRELHGRLTALKLLYNDLGAKVMLGKRDLERSLALSRKLQAEVESATEWLATADAELTRRSRAVLMPGDIDAQVAWAKATDREAEQRLAAMAVTGGDIAALVPGQSSRVEARVQLLGCKWEAVTSRNKEWLRLLLDHQTQMKALDLSCAHINAWIYKTEIVLELERDASGGRCRDGSGDYVLEGLQLELEDMHGKLAAVQEQGLALIRTQGGVYGGVVRTKLDTLSRQFQEISARIQMTADLSSPRKSTTPKPPKKTTALAVFPRWYQYERHDADLLRWLDRIERIHAGEAGKAQPLGPPVVGDSVPVSPVP